MRELGAAAEVTHVYFSDPGAAPLTVADLPFCRQVVAVPKPGTYGFSNAVRGILGRWPLPILNYTSAEMSSTVARLTEASRFDLIHLESIHMIRYAREESERHRDVRAVYNWHNIESEAMQRYGESTASALKSGYARLTARKMEALERLILKTAFGHVVCSARERRKLCGIESGARIAVVENGVDIGYFSGAASDSPRRIVFVGTMDYFPNSDAAVHFTHRIWPEVRRRLGDIELTIVGANPGPEVRELGNLPGVQVTGTVPDVRPWYRDALAAVVPLRTGGGTRLKILEAMAAGVPVVSTPLGAEGLDVTDGNEIMLTSADDPNGWADRLAALQESTELRARFIDAALRQVEANYDWERLGAKLLTTYETWLAAETASQGIRDR